MAVGSYIDSDGNNQGLIDTLSAGTWSFTEAPLPADALTTGQGASLHSLSCPVAGSCVAVGTYQNALGSQGLIETLGDGVWTPTTMPAPADSVFPSEPNATRGDVSCAAVGSCVAVWGYENTVGTLGDVIETLSQGTWTPLDAPLPANADPDMLQSDLVDLTCPAPGSCVAVGTYNINPYGPYGLSAEGLIETLSGGTWTPTEAAVPSSVSADAATSLEDVSCPSTGSCVAIGDFGNPESPSQGFIDALSGGTWTPTEAPLPANASRQYDVAPVSLSDLACPAVGSCVVVGDYTDLTYEGQGLVEALSGGTWTPTEAPLPANASTLRFPVSLAAVTCPAVGSCVAVGVYGTAGASVGVIETLSAGTWTPSEAPLPANASSGQTSSLTALACPAADACAAAGGYEESGDTQEGLLETRSEETPTILSVTTSSPTISSITLGQSDIDVAAVTGNAADGSPTGVMSFYACGPASGPAPCTSLADAVGAPLEVSSESGDSATATSVAFTPSTPGYWCLSASYSGDANYDPSSDATTDGCFDVTSDASSTVDAPATSTITVGQDNAGSATVTGTPGGAIPTGTVSFHLCGPTVAPTPCFSTADPVGDPVSVVTGEDDNSVAHSDLFVPTAPGYWCLAADYSGDTNYVPSSDVTTDGCFDVTGATSSTSATPTLSTIPLGHDDSDVATVTGSAPSQSPTGTVSFYECGPTIMPTACTALAHPVGTPVAVTAGSGATATVTSPAFTPDAGGYWCFAGYYSGDPNFTTSSDTTTDGCFDVPPMISSASAVTFAEGVSAIPFQVTSAGGYSPVTFSETGTLPSGVTFSSTGMLSGKPERVTGSFPITIMATDASGKTATQSFVLTVAGPPILIITSTSPLPQAKVGVAYAETLAAEGATLPYKWRIISSGLPRGLKLSTKTGAITGTPAPGTRGPHTFEVQVRHGRDAATARFSISVR